jgi:hypothetical protein
MQITGIFVFALLLTSPIAQQTPSPQKPAADNPAVTVLTGCLRSSGADTAVAGPSGRLYTLEVVEPPAKPSTTATTGTTPPVATKTTYSLSAPESVGLAKHADHQVQLTGALQTPEPAKTTGSPTPPTAKPGGAHRTFEVTGLKMIAPKCTA